MVICNRFVCGLLFKRCSFFFSIPPRNFLNKEEERKEEIPFPFVVTEWVISSVPLADEINYVDWLEIL